jgi:hypothetical protein
MKIDGRTNFGSRFYRASFHVMKLPKRHPEGIPGPALFSLDDLYDLQTYEVLDMHLERLRSMELRTEQLIEWLNLELLDRKDGVEDLPDGFEEFHEAVEDDSDEALESAINRHRDRILTILGHYAVIVGTVEPPVQITD